MPDQHLSPPFRHAIFLVQLALAVNVEFLGEIYKVTNMYDTEINTTYTI